MIREERSPTAFKVLIRRLPGSDPLLARKAFPITNQLWDVMKPFIVGCMSSNIGRGVWAWLLCALLFWLTVNPPHCDLCDGVSVQIASSHQPVLKHYHPIAPDGCNGICTCCGFYGLPNSEQVLVSANTVLADIVPESTRPALTPRSALFRPPRLVAS
jgi:hypothetical protein